VWKETTSSPVWLITWLVPWETKYGIPETGKIHPWKPGYSYWKPSFLGMSFASFRECMNIIEHPKQVWVRFMHNHP